MKEASAVVFGIFCCLCKNMHDMPTGFFFRNRLLQIKGLGRLTALIQPFWIIFFCSLIQGFENEQKLRLRSENDKLEHQKLGLKNTDLITYIMRIKNIL